MTVSAIWWNISWLMFFQSSLRCLRIMSHVFLKEMKEFTCHFWERMVLLMLAYSLFFHPRQVGICFENTSVLDYIATTQKCVCYANLCNLIRLLWVTNIDHCIWFVFIFWTTFLNYNIHTELSGIFVSIFGMVIMSLAYNKILLWSWLNHLS